MRRILLVTLGAVLAAAALLGAFAASPASAASPWWQLLSSSRPTNLALAPEESEVQKVSSSTVNLPSVANGVLVSPISVGGEAVGCLGVGEFISFGEAFFESPAAVCEKQTGFAAADTVETPAELAELLEGVYEAEVSLAGAEGHGEAPAGFGEGAFTLVSPWMPALELGPQVVVPNPFNSEESFKFGSASSQVLSEGSGRLIATLTNLGNAPLDATSTPLRIADRLPAGAAAYRVQGTAGGQGKSGPVHCLLETEKRFSCSFEEELAPYEAIEIEVFVALDSGAEGGEAGEVSVAGGDGPSESAPQALHLSDEEIPFGIEQFSMAAEEEGGEPTTRAGAHPFQLTTTILANSGRQEGSGPIGAHVIQPALPRNLRFTLPAGLIGNATAVPTCDMVTFLGVTNELVNECPDDSAVGVSSVSVVTNNLSGLARIAVPVFNLPPRRGEPARFGIVVAGSPALIDTSVDPSDSYRIRAEVHNITQVAQFLAATTTLWGVPGAKAHDASRGWNCAYFGAENLPGECTAPLPSERHDTPLLRMPVSCSSALPFEADLEPWNAPVGSVQAHASLSSPPLLACDREPFDPALSLAMTSRLASAPSGLDAEVSMPNAGLAAPAAETSETQFKRAEVTLPEGVSINPSQAEGLATCSAAAYARERYDSAPGDGCPEASKIGSVEVSTPLIEEKLNGALYVATPYENPTGGLIALYLVARVPERGVLVKQVGKVEPDPSTGQLRTVFDDVPQIPFSSFKLHFREGARSPLVTPPHCGAFQTTARFVPWSAQDPENPDPSEVVTRTAPFTIERGSDGGACPSGGPPPFHPGLLAGTINNAAGHLLPLRRAPDPHRLQNRRSPTSRSSCRRAIVGKLAGIPYCPDAASPQAKATHRPPRRAAKSSTPPPARRHRRSAAAWPARGSGQVLTYVPGKVYLAGPYHGSTMSHRRDHLRRRRALRPRHRRDPRGAADRPRDRRSLHRRHRLGPDPPHHQGRPGPPARHPRLRRPPRIRPQPDRLHPHLDRKTVLGSGPGLRLRSRRQPDHGHLPLPGRRLRGPALQAPTGPAPEGRHPQRRPPRLLRPPEDERDRRSGDRLLPGHPAPFGVHRERPLQDDLHQGAVQSRGRQRRPSARRARSTGTPGPPPRFSQSRSKARSSCAPPNTSCPTWSSPCTTPRSTSTWSGRVDSVKGGGLRNTFEAAPDAPVSSFDLFMAGGKKGLFVNSTNLCAKTYRAKSLFIGQNGKRYDAKPKMRAVKCKGKRKKAHRRHKRVALRHYARAAG